MKTRILLTGGHAATTALAVVEEILRRGAKNKDASSLNSWDIYWIGAERAIEGKAVRTLESQIFPKMGVISHSIVSGRIQRRLTIWTLPNLLKIPFGFFHAFYLLLKIKPKIILSFGGFAAFPVVLAGFLMRIPIIVHEQTSEVGRANKLSAFFATKIALARESSKKHFKSSKAVVVGNPILTQVAEILPKEKLGYPPTIFICGGSRGSQTINELVEPILGELTSKYYVIHQTGVLDYQKFLSKKKDNNEVYDLIDPMQIDGIYRRADIVIGRAGANTVSEIMAAKRPSLLIPIPWTYLNEQKENAVFAQNFGIAKVLEQEDLTSRKLLFEINLLIENWEKISKKVKDKKSPDLEASNKLVDLIEGQLK